MNQKQYPRGHASQVQGSLAESNLARKTPLGENIENVPFRSIKHSGGERNNRFGGKFAGLTFMCNLLSERVIKNRTFGGIEVKFMIPPTWELPNGFHVDFINHNQGIVTTGSHSDIRESFAQAKLPKSVTEALRLIVRAAKSDVLVIRSDSFCEDGIHPFAGEFTTEFVVLKGTEEQKIEQLGAAFKLVSASLYEPKVQKLIKQLGLSSSEQWMSFVVQEVHGKEHALDVDGRRTRLFFPDASMVALSKCLNLWNPKITRTDPIARIAAGLGTKVVEKEGCCRTMALRYPGTPGPGESYSVSFMEKGDTSELDDYADRTQSSFHAIDLSSGKVVDIRLEQIPRKQLCELFPAIISGYSERRGTIDHGISDYGDYGILRTTFMGDTKNRDFYSAVLVELISKLREMAGFEVDIELAINRDSKTFEVALLQLRPFGTGIENAPVTLSEVHPGRLITRGKNCIGHGEHEFSVIAVLLQYGAGTRETLSKLNDAYPNKYVLIGPNAEKNLGIGGAYEGCITPGAVVELRGTGKVTMDTGTHHFNNIAMKQVMRVEETDINMAPIKGDVRNGVLISNQKAKLEINGETGEGQLFLLD